MSLPREIKKPYIFRWGKIIRVQRGNCFVPREKTDTGRTSCATECNGMKKAVMITISLLIFVLCFPGCSGKNGAGMEGRPVISVDDHVLTVAEFNEYFEPLKMSYAKQEGEDGGSLREARARFLLELIEEMIILRRAEELGLQVSSAEMQQALENLEADYDDQGLEDMFMRQAISMETWKKRVRRQLLVGKVLSQDLGEAIFVTPEEIRQYYDEHHEAWDRGEQVRVRHILLSSQKQANEVLKKIKDGEDFAVVARQYSTAPEARAGGDMGYIVRGQLPERLEAPIFSLELNSVSPVIKTSYGYHIFKVLEKRPAGKPELNDRIEEIRQCVKKEKIERAYGPWLAKLRSRYKITVNKEII
jgi:peptidyl-prolyl cis-trans isomerase C